MTGEIMQQQMDDLITAGEMEMEALFDEYRDLLTTKKIGEDEISHALTKAWQDINSPKCGNGVSPIEYMRNLINEVNQ